MKYSIFQFSQEKLLENGLDVIDALILSWFSDFFMTGMEKRIFKEESGGKLYGWVKLSKVLEDIPCIGINSEKGIKRRFDGFVEKGIMSRQSIITQNGKKTYYRPTEIYDELVNTKTSSVEKSEKTETKNQQEEIPQGYFNSHAENKNLQGTKTTDANLRIAQKSSHGYFHSHAQGNENILPQGHFDSHALNDSSARNSSTTDAAVIQSEDFEALSEKYFGKNAFDAEFPRKAANFFTKTQIKDYEQYFDFIKNRLTETQNLKQVKNPRGFAYRLFFQPDIAQSFLEQQQYLLLKKQKEEAKQRKIEERKLVCPCCGKKFLPDYISTCPECDFAIDNFKNKEKINIHINFLKLSEVKKEEYLKEINKIYFSNNFFESLRETPEQRKQKSILREQQEKELNKKYGLVG